MSKVCVVCEKRSVIGGHTARRGMARIKGGAGRKITGRSKRAFKTNVHKIKIVDAKGRVTSAYVCAKCLKAGKVKKAR
ncbi:50S ribosomal protein L28 [Candidatus Velamenicoccus archaeovorus]|uniref:50S ribosomal protein L28 n=1 Tax=Velamenicoccus archaeovorus TaxID=1930593 RepID=A0A410P5C5_VELA1|nr:L28 family ribosomal protein [Candidatus Velamenicoccus archaeovorus]QAT17312.1 50S ribosomal protein L28 [Candidatus Velamenicoccus archaeovorus]